MRPACVGDKALCVPVSSVNRKS